jgi:hypothetical protein
MSTKNETLRRGEATDHLFADAVLARNVGSMSEAFITIIWFEIDIPVSRSSIIHCRTSSSIISRLEG